MRVIEVRSWRELDVGETVSYPNGESVTLLEVRSGIFSARARIRLVYEDHVDSPLHTRMLWADLDVHFLHPRFFMQHVGLLPG